MHASQVNAELQGTLSAKVPFDFSAKIWREGLIRHTSDWFETGIRHSGHKSTFATTGRRYIAVVWISAFLGARCSSVRDVKSDHTHSVRRYPALHFQIQFLGLLTLPQRVFISAVRVCRRASLPLSLCLFVKQHGVAISA